MKAKFEIIL